MAADKLLKLLELQQMVLESIAKGRKSTLVLDDLCRLIEAMVPGSLTSVMRLDDQTGLLNIAAGPSFPAEALPYFKDLKPGVGTGSCGNAALCGSPVIISDVPSDRRWDDLRQAARCFNIGACWSIPILSENQRVMGTFAITSFKSSSPSPFHLRLLETASHLASITIRMRQREKRLLQWNTVFADAAEGMFITDAKGNIIDTNQAFTRITGFSAVDVIGKNPQFLRSGRHEESFYHSMWNSIRETGKWQGEIWNRRKNGEVFPEWLSISRIGNRLGETYNYVAVFSDISALKESERKLFHLAHHDPLTGLPNRLLMNARLEQILEQAKRNPTRIAVMFIDLDRFKNVNDTFGHALGDQLLIEVAKRIKSRLRSEDTIARIGGDEFVIILQQLAHPEDAANLAQICINMLDKPFQISNHEIFISPSIGITLFPDDGSTIDTLLKNADAAMYHAKELGRHRYSFYASAISSQV